MEASMFALRLFAAGAEETNLGWLVWVVLAIFAVMVFLGWLVASKGWLKQEEETVSHDAGHGEQHDAHAHAEHGHDHAPAEPAVPAHPATPDNLISLEGIGPKVAKLLETNGITTFAALAATDLGKLREILDEAGYKYMEPSGWVDQAKLAAAGDAEGLAKLQETLKGGRRVA
jgi:predicted flap endonuclease-1-like 5' DNA nuclease